MIPAISEEKPYRITSALYLCYGIAVGMMVCLAVVVVQVLKWVRPQTFFDYLIPFSGFVALEAIISTHSLQDEDFLTSRWLSRRLTEWAVLAILVKALSYFSIGFNQLAQDLLLWDDQFSTFFNPEYLIGIVVTALIWLFSSRVASLSGQIAANREQLDLERQGIALQDRRLLRIRLTALVFVIGSCMLAVIAFAAIGKDILPEVFPSSRSSYTPVMLFFAGGLILVSITQYIVQKSRWYIYQIPTSRIIATRWIGLGIVFIALAVLISSLLPTQYSVGLLGIFQVFLSYALYILAIIEFLMVAPFLIFVNTILKLFGLTPVPVIPPTTRPPTPMAPPGETFSESPWDQLIRSILFWTIFFGVIFIAFRHYYRQNQEIVEVLRKQPYLKWAFQIWDWIKSIFSHARNWTRNALPARRKKPTSLRQKIGIRLPALAPLIEKLPPRQKIRLTYLLMTEWVGAQGYPRNKNETPGEYAAKLSTTFPAASGNISELTEFFVLARYSIRAIRMDQARAAAASWKTLQNTLKTHLSSEQNIPE